MSLVRKACENVTKDNRKSGIFCSAIVERVYLLKSDRLGLLYALKNLLTTRQKSFRWLIRYAAFFSANPKGEKGYQGLAQD